MKVRHKKRMKNFVGKTVTYELNGQTHTGVVTGQELILQINSTTGAGNHALDATKVVDTK